GSWRRCGRSIKWPTYALPAFTAASKRRRSLCEKSKDWRPIMIQLKADCLMFQTNDGEQVPCSAEWVTLELMGEGASLVDPEVVRHASAAVLHYFKHELQRPFVSVSEFALALEKVLRGFGLSVYADHEADVAAPKELRVLYSNLVQLASCATESFELLFFPQLRQELQRQMQQSPQVLRFCG